MNYFLKKKKKTSQITHTTDFSTEIFTDKLGSVSHIYSRCVGNISSLFRPTVRGSYCESGVDG